MTLCINAQHVCIFRLSPSLKKVRRPEPLPSPVSDAYSFRTTRSGDELSSSSAGSRSRDMLRRFDPSIFRVLGQRSRRQHPRTHCPCSQSFDRHALLCCRALPPRSSHGCDAIRTSSFVGGVIFVQVKAKFHYTGPTGPARTSSETRTDPREFLGDPGRKRSPCGSGRVRSGPCSGI